MRISDQVLLCWYGTSIVTPLPWSCFKSDISLLVRNAPFMKLSSSQSSSSSCLSSSLSFSLSVLKKSQKIRTSYVNAPKKQNALLLMESFKAKKTSPTSFFIQASLLALSRCSLDCSSCRAGGDHKALAGQVGHGVALLRGCVAFRVCRNHKTWWKSLARGKPFALRMVQAIQATHWHGWHGWHVWWSCIAVISHVGRSCHVGSFYRLRHHIGRWHSHRSCRWVVLHEENDWRWWRSWAPLDPLWELSTTSCRSWRIHNITMGTSKDFAHQGSSRTLQGCKELRPPLCHWQSSQPIRCDSRKSCGIAGGFKKQDWHKNLEVLADWQVLSKMCKQTKSIMLRGSQTVVYDCNKAANLEGVLWCRRDSPWASFRQRRSMLRRRSVSARSVPWCFFHRMVGWLKTLGCLKFRSTNKDKFNA